MSSPRFPSSGRPNDERRRDPRRRLGRARRRENLPRPRAGGNGDQSGLIPLPCRNANAKHRRGCIYPIARYGERPSTRVFQMILYILSPPPSFARAHSFCFFPLLSCNVYRSFHLAFPRIRFLPLFCCCCYCWMAFSPSPSLVALLHM